jgi:serine/threonine-protein kinase RsbW
VGGEAAARLAIVVEELVANIFDHGGLKPDECVEMSLSRLGREVSLTLEDRGNAFDPRQPPLPNVETAGAGAGLGLINAWTRILSYESAGEVNRLELIIPLDATPSGGNP